MYVFNRIVRADRGSDNAHMSGRYTLTFPQQKVAGGNCQSCCIAGSNIFMAKTAGAVSDGAALLAVLCYKKKRPGDMRLPAFQAQPAAGAVWACQP